MSIIICTTPQPIYLPLQDEWDSPIGEVLIVVGQKHLARIPEDYSDWLTFGQVAGLCRSFHHTLPKRNYRLEQLQPEILALFNGRDSIVRDGVKIRYESKEVHTKNTRLPKTVHQLKFYRVHL
jgi:hypothetical protein